MFLMFKVISCLVLLFSAWQGVEQNFWLNVIVGGNTTVAVWCLIIFILHHKEIFSDNIIKSQEFWTRKIIGDIILYISMAKLGYLVPSILMSTQLVVFMFLYAYHANNKLDK